ncbi:interleukin-6 receptor subunit beta [Plakobranchus ocellatus]|uniref:Interleukin-6 receptor subunit beta n=1 Tax=Plakobranchus ocellatus TaxID=259542 RepID=A0AAV4CP71_9GAST|nr:interleukin-6 receptor subunit beta [Plakobranchus ocellatus]
MAQIRHRHGLNAALSQHHLCFILLLSACNSGVCSGLSDFLTELQNTLSGAITGKTYIYVGSTLELTCTLSDQWAGSWTSQQLNFFVSQPLNFQVPAREECIPAKYVRIVDSSSATLRLHHVSLKNSGQYSCSAGQTSCEREDLIGIADDVNVEYAPHNVTNFKCVVRDWTESMKCTWDHPVEYVNWNHVAVTLKSATVFSKTSVSCPHLTLISCTWRNVKEFTAAYIYVLEVNVTNIVTKDKAQKVFTIKTLENVKPSAVENLVIKSAENMDGCLNITWTHRKIYRRKIFRIRRRAVGNTNFTVLRDDLSNSSFVTCGYGPMTQHVFAIDCRPSGRHGFWSDPRLQEQREKRHDNDKSKLEEKSKRIQKEAQQSSRDIGQHGKVLTCNEIWHMASLRIGFLIPALYDLLSSNATDHFISSCKIALSQGGSCDDTTEFFKIFIQQYVKQKVCQLNQRP